MAQEHVRLRDEGIDPKERPKYITEINDNDVLMGKRHGAIKNPGNRSFREIIRSRKHEYVRADRYKVKNQIASEIFDQITKRGGRFLRKIESAEEAKELKVPKTVIEDAWTLAEQHVSLEKIKQSLREKEHAQHDDDEHEEVDDPSDGPHNILEKITTLQRHLLIQQESNQHLYALLSQQQEQTVPYAALQQRANLLNSPLSLALGGNMNYPIFGGIMPQNAAFVRSPPASPQHNLASILLSRMQPDIQSQLAAARLQSGRLSVEVLNRSALNSSFLIPPNIAQPPIEQLGNIDRRVNDGDSFSRVSQRSYRKRKAVDGKGGPYTSRKNEMSAEDDIQKTHRHKK